MSSAQHLEADDLAAGFLNIPDLLGGTDSGVLRLPGGIYLGVGSNKDSPRSDVGVSHGVSDLTGRSELGVGSQTGGTVGRGPGGGAQPMVARGNAAVERENPSQDPFANLFS